MAFAIRKTVLGVAMMATMSSASAVDVILPDLPTVPASAIQAAKTNQASVSTADEQVVLTAEQEKKVLSSPADLPPVEEVKPAPLAADGAKIPLTPMEEAALARAKMKASNPKEGEVITLKRPPLVSEVAQRKPVETKLEIIAEPGVNQIIEVAIGHPNRIVTPFSTPTVMKVDKDVVVDVKQNVVYLATNQSRPVTMYIREAGTEVNAISLTLVPKRIPPRELRIRFNNGGDRFAMFQRNEAARKWEESGDYVSKIKALARGIALNEIPGGYTLRKLAGTEMPPYCAQGGLNFDFNEAQVVDGHHLQAVIGVIRNNTNREIEFIETTCGDYNVRAVAAWPKTYLMPGDKTEVYIVRAKGQRGKPKQVRPSLLDR